MVSSPSGFVLNPGTDNLQTNRRRLVVANLGDLAPGTQPPYGDPAEAVALLLHLGVPMDRISVGLMMPIRESVWHGRAEALAAALANHVQADSQTSVRLIRDESPQITRREDEKYGDGLSPLRIILFGGGFQAVPPLKRLSPAISGLGLDLNDRARPTDQFEWDELSWALAMDRLGSDYFDEVVRIYRSTADGSLKLPGWRLS